MSKGELFIVATERHVERLSGEGKRAETRSSLRARLVTALLPDVTFLDAGSCRLVLGMALEAERAKVTSDALLGGVFERGGRPWARTLDALDEAIGTLRSRGVGRAELEAASGAAGGVVGARARSLALAMGALDARLESLGARDVRVLPTLLAAVVARMPPDALVLATGASRLVARWLLSWEPDELAWFRGLDEVLSRHSGYARIVLPVFERRLEGTRDSDPLETLVDDMARRLDTAPETEAIAAVLGDLTLLGTPMDSGLEPEHDRIRVGLVDTAGAQAELVADAVAGALASGAAVERVAIGFPTRDEHTLAPLRRALAERGIVAYEARGEPPSEARVVTVALEALAVAGSLERRAVAKVLGSGYVDAVRIAGESVAPRDAKRALERVVHRLTANATQKGDDPVTRFAHTAKASTGPAQERGADGTDALDGAFVDKLARVLSAPAVAKTRTERARAARVLWSSLGIGARAGRGALESFAVDVAPTALRRAEREAIARDASAWNALVFALDAYEAMAARIGAEDACVDDETFRGELSSLLDSAGGRPSAARGGAVRIEPLEKLAGEALSLLIVVDANEGRLPREEPHRAFASEALLAAVAAAWTGGRTEPATVFGTPQRPFALSSTPRRARELTSLAVAASEAEQILFIATREDATGALVAPSPLVTALIAAGVQMAPAPQPPQRRHLPPDVLRRVHREHTREAFFLDPARPLGELVGRIEPVPEARRVLVAATGGGPRALAVTALERFASCAFMGYAHTVLGVREPSEQGELPDAREEGILVHAALAAAFVATRDAWSKRPWDAAAIFDVGLAAGDRAVSGADAHAPLRAIARLRVREAVRGVLRMALADEAWEFFRAEQGFGMDSETTSWPVFRIEADGEVLTLRGSIDRLDIARDRQSLRVVDYKRSKSKVDQMSRALGETALQVPLYACVARRALGLPATGIYVPFQPRDALDAKTTPHGRMGELVTPPGTADAAPVEVLAVGLAAKVRSGAFAPLPVSETACMYCAVSGACRKPLFAMAALDDDDGGSA